MLVERPAEPLTPLAECDLPAQAGASQAGGLRARAIGADRHRRHGMPLSRRRRWSQGVLAAAVRSAWTPSAKCRPTAGTSTTITIPTRPRRGKMNTRCGGFLKRVDEFDAEFFGISPREAVRVDPQHRLLLEVAWEALEDAGMPCRPTSRRPRRASTSASSATTTPCMQAKDLGDMDVFSGTGCSHAILANRLSYVLNLNGPSITLDTACSSSLVTVHLACQSLRRREIRPGAGRRREPDSQPRDDASR